MLDFRYRTFLDLARELNYTRTAQNLYLTQPTITKHIQTLEKDLQVRLFDYAHKKLTLTKDGNFLYREITQLQQKIEEIEASFQKNNQPKQELLIGASHAIGEHYLHKNTSFFEQDELPYHLIIENPSILLQKLEQGEIDCALIADDLPPNLSFKATSFFQDEIVLITGQQTDNLVSMSLDTLKNQFLLLRETDSGIFRSLKRQLQKHDFHFQDCSNAKHIGNSELIKRLLLTDCHLAFFYQVTINDELAAKALKTIVIEGIELKQDFHLVYPENSKKLTQISLLEGIISTNPST